MSHRILFVLIWPALLIAFELYAFQAVRTLLRDSSPGLRTGVYWGYWLFSLFLFGGLIWFFRNMNTPGTQGIRAMLSALFFANLLFKLVVSLFMLMDDGRRLAVFTGIHFIKKDVEDSTTPPISRSDFLAKAALILGVVPAMGMIYGVARGGHRYKVWNIDVPLANLPPAFDGLRIVQISDVHSGSFFSRQGVEHGIQKILDQKPDIIFFTGDLVNNLSEEIEPFKALFARLKAPMGVFSVLGNHDYSDYVQWESREAKQNNLLKLIGHHREMGWDILLDENRVLERNGQKLALIGVQNWSARNSFPKYGDLGKALRGVEQIPAKILLSHDPSHWDGEVNSKYTDIGLMLAGHTHGMQFGIDSKVLKWSPVQYVYEQWAGLYQKGSQYLYVNRGFGFIGYPGRLGIWPEITVITLRANGTATAYISSDNQKNKFAPDFSPELAQSL